MTISEFRYKGAWVVIRVPNACAPVSVSINGVPIEGSFDSLRMARSAAIRTIDKIEEEAE